MTTQQLRAAFWGVDLLLTAVAVFFLVKSAQHLFASPKIAPAPLQSPTTAAFGTQPATIKPYEQYAALGKGDLFGKLSSTNVAAQKVVEEKLPETTLELELLGTVAAQDPELGFAIIRDKKSRTEGTYGVKDYITGNVRVEEIRQYEVVISHGGRREVLVMSFADESPFAMASTGPFGALRPTAFQPPAQAAAGSDEPIRVINENLRYINREQLTRQIGGSLVQLISDFRVSPNTVDNKPAGVRVDQAGSGPLASQTGILPGDIIKSVNGIRVNSMEDVIANSARLENSPEIRVVVERDGRHRTLVYKVR
ncbi:MAG: hypothetical protein Kow0099_05990 [Candidatus Abyssubacteria bacterium]